MRLDFHKFFRAIVVRLLAVDTSELDRTFGQTILCGSEGELPTAQVAMNREIPFTFNPFEHCATSDSNYSDLAQRNH